MCNLGESIWQEGIAEGLAMGKAEGLAEGEARGLAKGELKQAIITAKQMLKENKFGFTLEDIAKFTGLSINELKKLQA